MNITFKLILVFLITINILYAKEIRHHGVKFTLSEEMLNNDGYLVRLILNAESMDDKERQYWFSVFSDPINSDKKYRLEKTLDNEKRKLGELERVYEKRLRALIKKEKEQKEEEYKNIADAKQIIHHNVKFIVSNKMLKNDTYLVNLILEASFIGDIERQRLFYYINKPINYNKRYKLEEILEKNKIIFKKNTNEEIIKSLKNDMDNLKRKLKTEKVGDSELIYND